MNSAGINKFSAMTAREKKAFFGRSKGAKKNHTPKSLKSSNIDHKDISSLPTSVDWRDAGIVSADKDQGEIVRIVVV